MPASPVYQPPGRHLDGVGLCLDVVQRCLKGDVFEVHVFVRARACVCEQMKEYGQVIDSLPADVSLRLVTQRRVPESALYDLTVLLFSVGVFPSALRH